MSAAAVNSYDEQMMTRSGEPVASPDLTEQGGAAHGQAAHGRAVCGDEARGDQAEGDEARCEGGRREARPALSAEERERLTRWARGATTPRRLVTRSLIVLLAAAGGSDARIAAQLRITRATVARWTARFRDGGPHALTIDAPGRGRKPGRDAAIIARVLRASAASPPAGTRWTVRSLAQAAGVSPASVQRVWREQRITPGTAGAAATPAALPARPTPPAPPARPTLAAPAASPARAAQAPAASTSASTAIAILAAASRSRARSHARSLIAETAPPRAHGLGVAIDLPMTPSSTFTPRDAHGRAGDGGDAGRQLLQRKVTA